MKIEQNADKIIILNSQDHGIYWIALYQNHFILTQEYLHNNKKVISQFPFATEDFKMLCNDDDRWIFSIYYNKDCSKTFYNVDITSAIADISCLFKIVEYNMNVEDFVFTTNHTVDDLQKLRNDKFGLTI